MFLGFPIVLLLILLLLPCQVCLLPFLPLIRLWKFWEKVSASGGGRQAFSSVGEISDRPLCDKVQQEGRGLVFSSSRSLRHGRGPPSASLGQPGCLCLSPFCLVCHVLNRVMISQKLRMTLVAPLWPQAEWFPDLLSLLSAVSREIPPWHNLLCQLHVE